MRVLYVITKSSQGGAQTHIFQLCRFMISRGHQCAIMAYPGGWLEGAVRKLGAEFIPNEHFKNSYSLINLLKARASVRAAIKSFQPDLVSCHSGFAGLVGRLAAKGLVPVVFTAHGWSFAPGVPLVQKVLTSMAEKFSAKLCEKIICVSEYDRQLALRHDIVPASKLITIPNGVELTEGPEPDQSTKKVQVVFVGRFQPQKNPYVLLKATASLPAEARSRASLVFVGDGPERPKVEKMIKELGLKEQTELLGSVSRARVLQVMQESNIFALTSFWEGMPRALLEAMSVGLPTVASDIGGNSEVVTDKTGFVLDKNQEEENLRQVLEKLVLDSELRERLGRAGRQRAREFFGLPRMFRQTYQVYQNLVSKDDLNGSGDDA